MRREILGAVVVALSLALSAPLASAEYELHHYSPGKQYYAVSLVDWDGDGVLEVAAANWAENKAEIWDYDTGTREMALVESIPLPYNTWDLDAADLDHDGDVDLVAGVRFYGTYVILNQGGSWTTVNLDPTYCFHTMIVDFDGDGHPDIYSSLDYHLIRIFYGDGNGGFALGPSPLPECNYDTPSTFDVCDFNLDGRPDLLGTVFCYGHQGSWVRAYPNLSTPGHPAWGASVGPTDTYPPMWGPGPSVADFDGNGYFDMVRSMGGDPLIFWGQGGGGAVSWTPGSNLDEYTESDCHVYSGDLNDDGNPDVVVGGYEGADPESPGTFYGLRMYYGDGTGNFRYDEVPMDHGVTNRNDLKLGDVNGDGRTDIVAARWTRSNDGFDVLLQYPDVTLDLHPGSCPNPLSVNKQGVIPSALLAPANFDVRSVDLSSITLMGVPPKKTSYADVGTPFRGGLCECSEDGPDGHEDLTLKFSAPAVREALGEVHVGDVVSLTLTGVLLDGTPFEVSDCMKIVGPKDKVTRIPGEEDTPGPDEIPISFDVTAETGPGAAVQRVGYDLPEPADVTLGVYDVRGRLVRHLVQAPQPAGSQVVEWDAAGLPSGVYFYRITAGNRVEAARVTIIHWAFVSEPVCLTGGRPPQVGGRPPVDSTYRPWGTDGKERIPPGRRRRTGEPGTIRSSGVPDHCRGTVYQVTLVAALRSDSLQQLLDGALVPRRDLPGPRTIHHPASADPPHRSGVGPH